MFLPEFHQSIKRARPWAIVLLLTFPIITTFAEDADDARVSALIAKLDSPAADVRVTAARALGRIGTKAERAIPALVAASKNANDLGEEIHALGQLGAAAVPALLEQLKQDNEDTRVYCLGALQLAGPSARAAIPRLIELLSDKSVKIRNYTIIALCAIGPGDENVIQAVSRFLNDPKAPESKVSARCLATMGSQGKSAIPALVAMLSGTSVYDEPEDAEAALFAIGEAAIPELIAGLKPPQSDDHARYCAKILGRFGKTSVEAALPELLSLLKSNSASLRLSVYDALRATQDPRALKAMADCLKVDRSRAGYSEQLFAADGLSRAGAAGVELLAAELFLNGGQESPLVAETLASMGPQAKPALEILIARLRLKRGEAEIVKAAAAIGADAVPDVAELLKGNAIARRNAIDVFAAMAPHFQEAADALTAVLQGPEVELWGAAAEALCRFGPRGRAAIPDLLRMLAEKDPVLRISAMRALENIGPEASAALPQLKKLLWDAPVEVRVAAIFAVGRIEMRPEELLAQITSLLLDPNADVRTAVAIVLEHLDEAARPAAPELAKLLEAKPPANAPGPSEATLPGKIVESRETREVRTSVVSALKYIGSNDPTVLRALAGALRDPATAQYAFDSLMAQELKPEWVLPELMEMLNSDEHSIHLFIICPLLAKLGKGAAPAIDALVKSIVRDMRTPPSSIDNRGMKAAETLAAIGAPAVPALLTLIKNADERVIQRALYALANMAPGEAVDAVPALIERSKKNGGADYYAIEVFRNSGPKAAAAIPLLEEAAAKIDFRRPWGKSEFPDRSSAVYPCAALSAITGNPKPSIEKLKAILLDDPKPVAGADASEQSIVNFDESKAVATGLAGLGDAALPVLLEAVSDERWRVQYSAYEGIKAIGKLSAIPHAIVEKWFGNGEAPALGLFYVKDLGPAAAFAAPHALQFLNASEWRYDTLEALRALGPAAKDAVPQIAAMLRDPQQSAERETLLEILAGIGPDAKPALPLLIELVEHPAACRAIQKMGPAAKDALPPLLAALRQNPASENCIVPALGAIGPDAAVAVDALIDQLLTQNNSLDSAGGSPRRRACEALGAIGHAASKAIPFLLVASRDPNQQVRKAARAALARLAE